MARLNEILVGRFNRLFQKVYGIKGGPPVSTLAPEIMPTHPIFAGVESRYVDSWNRFAVSMQRGPTAAQTNAVRIRNPVGSNVIAALEAIKFSTTTQQIIQLAIATGQADLPTATGVPVAIDGRQTAFAVLSVTASDASPGVVGPCGQFEVNVSVVTDLVIYEDQALVLSPGQSVTINNQTVNTNLFVQYIWRERFLEEGERL